MARNYIFPVDCVWVGRTLGYIREHIEMTSFWVGHPPRPVIKSSSPFCQLPIGPNYIGSRLICFLKLENIDFFFNNSDFEKKKLVVFVVSNGFIFLF